MAELITKSPDTAYATKGNIAYPGNSTAAGLVETAAEDTVESMLGLSANELSGKFTVSYDKSVS